MRKVLLLFLVSIIVPRLNNPCEAANDVVTSDQQTNVATEQVDKLISKIKETLSDIRGLEFTGTTKRGIKTRSELKEYLRHKTLSEIPEEKIYATKKALVKLGFIPPDLDLMNFLLDLYTEQVAGFYDWNVGTLYLIKEVPIEMQEMVIAHEMTHALQDLHFNLKSLPLERKDNDDLVFATQALLEGEALLVMMDYMLKPMGIDTSSLPNVDALLQQATSLAGMGVFRYAPIWVKRNMLFPYLEGFIFVQEVKKRKDGWNGLNKCYMTPPQSTEQILHPEKYLIENDTPTVVSLPRLSEQLGDGWNFLDENVLGEFNVDLLFHQHLSQDTFKSHFSSGWDGDLLQVYENKDLNKVLIVWLTTWDSDKDAKEFFDGYNNVVKDKYNETHATEAASNFFLYETMEDMVYLELRDSNVLILEGVPSHSLNQVIAQVWQSGKEKPHN